jgi:hypothetical protein
VRWLLVLWTEQHFGRSARTAAEMALRGLLCAAIPARCRCCDGRVDGGFLVQNGENEASTAP